MTLSSRIAKSQPVHLPHRIGRGGLILLASAFVLAACGQKRDIFISAPHKIPQAVGEEGQPTHSELTKTSPEAHPVRNDEQVGASHDPKPPDDFDLPPL